MAATEPAGGAGLGRSRKLVPVSAEVADALASAARRLGLGVAELVGALLDRVVSLDGAAETMGSGALDPAAYGLAPLPLRALAALPTAAVAAAVARAASLVAASLRAGGYDCATALQAALAAVLGPVRREASRISLELGALPAEVARAAAEAALGGLGCRASVDLEGRRLLVTFA